MKNIEVAVLNEAHSSPAGMMMFLAKLTQRGHNISDMDDLKLLYADSILSHKAAKSVVKLPHGTIKRFSPITIAVVGASRRFLAQARTHHVGIDFVSASLQYSDYSNKGSFVVPYPVLECGKKAVNNYLQKCKNDLSYYQYLITEGLDNDSAGYVMNQALRNVLVIQANHEAWMNFIRLRACHRNTSETQYIALRIWEELLKTNDGKKMFAYAGPDCAHGSCREGKFSCGNPMKKHPSQIIKDKYPLLFEDDVTW